jgi:UDP-glucuronate decarboxylase
LAERGTGGVGSIGSFLREALLTRGDEVLCVGNFYNGIRRNGLDVVKTMTDAMILHRVPEHIRSDNVLCSEV